MPDTLTMPPAAPVAEEEPALHVCVWDHVARTVAWLDAANGRGPHEIAVRVMKIAEETGEAVSRLHRPDRHEPPQGRNRRSRRPGRRAVRRGPGRLDRPGHDHRRHPAGRIGAAPARRRPRGPAPRAASRRMTAPTEARAPASPPMRPRDFAELADEVAATCQRYGVRTWSEDDRERLDAALWRFIHPDLAHGPGRPLHRPGRQLKEPWS